MITLKLQGFQETKEMLVKELGKFNDLGTATVGVHEGAGVHPNGDGETFAEIAIKNHFGSGNIPARPFLDVGVESVIPKINRAVEIELIKGKPRQALEQMARLAVGGVQAYMTDLQYPPNAPYTIEKKGSSNPLIDTGALRANITSEIRKK